MKVESFVRRKLIQDFGFKIEKLIFLNVQMLYSWFVGKLAELVVRFHMCTNKNGDKPKLFSARF
jgi:hypothetical protein